MVEIAGELDLKGSYRVRFPLSSGIAAGPEFSLPGW